MTRPAAEPVVLAGVCLLQFLERAPDRPAGKPAKVALLAVMRKLIVLFNTMLKHHAFQLATLHSCFMISTGNRTP